MGIITQTYTPLTNTCSKCGKSINPGDAFCSSCGQPVNAGKPETPRTEKFCFECGAVINAKAEICPKCGVRQPVFATQPVPQPDKKNKLVAAILAIFLGSLGIHRFYLGQIRQGILFIVCLVVLGTVGAWAIVPIVAFIEGIVLLTMGEQTFDAKYNRTGGAAPLHRYDRNTTGLRIFIGIILSALILVLLWVWISPLFVGTSTPPTADVSKGDQAKPTVESRPLADSNRPGKSNAITTAE